MTKLKRWLTVGGISSLALFLAACGQTTTKNGVRKPPTDFFNGTLYKYIAQPLQHLMEWISGFFSGPNGYGIAIILITLVVRMILLPLMLNQQKNMTISQEKTKLLKPQLDIVQAQMKKATTPEEQMQVNQLMQRVYKENGTSMIPPMGCLTILIQLPIFSGLYQAVAYSTEISNSTFFGIQLGKPNMIVTIIATLLYVAQSYIMMQGVSEDQKKAMRTTMWLSPGMTFFFCLMSPAGLGLYFLAGGLIILIQQVIVTYVITPSIRKRLDAEMAENPPVIVVDEHTFDKQNASAPAAKGNANNAASTNSESNRNRNRNAGKQQRHH
ncbi:membrane protein insertase YidC [Lacticaseibacillus saniviri]|uniref:Preprotein translocase subunit YidC n=1 Tax=Lacticaseibacillus saniviri JCM 17471 = DSM 24301 TaxID=1293598 RepID=A0A0R2MY96_9LACO|nr:membrane protein insertase YidC [Lacticaseibacillus saniviri]KRO18535.1 preprotein translocase subunit YidC [Lacticaseibacillus saniviri JCM 17471 = DSM 24301]MCG4281181.1 membrane protein insertase YidC [Lacticaseibacillus saniviri]